MTTYQMAELGALVGEPARAAMLTALMDGRALTATELANAAGVTPQTASAHLARLAEAHLVEVERQGRHRYHRIASGEVARLIEAFMQVVASTVQPARRRPVIGPRDAAMRRARTCYDHLAGGLGVAICDALLERGAIEFDDGAGLVTDSGVALLRRSGLWPVESKRSSSRPLCRPCLDWSERRRHLAGRLGATLCSRFFEQGFIRRINDTRALAVTGKGKRALRDLFGIREF